MGVVLSEHFEQQLQVVALQAAAGVVGPLHGAKIGLFTNNIVLSETTLLADLLAPTYAGYADLVAAFGSVYHRREGGVACLSALVQFGVAVAAEGTTCYGMYITDGAVTPKLLAAELFPGGPIGFATALSAINVIAQVAFGGPDFGSGEYSN